MKESPMTYPKIRELSDVLTGYLEDRGFHPWDPDLDDAFFSAIRDYLPEFDPVKMHEHLISTIEEKEADFIKRFEETSGYIALNWAPITGAMLDVIAFNMISLIRSRYTKLGRSTFLKSGSKLGEKINVIEDAIPF